MRRNRTPSRNARILRKGFMDAKCPTLLVTWRVSSAGVHLAWTSAVRRTIARRVGPIGRRLARRRFAGR
eukprot:6193568-Pleurochrysis_carterae.AAC.1